MYSLAKERELDSLKKDKRKKNELQLQLIMVLQVENRDKVCIFSFRNKLSIYGVLYRCFNIVFKSMILYEECLQTNEIWFY